MDPKGYKIVAHERTARYLNHVRWWSKSVVSMVYKFIHYLNGPSISNIYKRMVSAAPNQ